MGARRSIYREMLTEADPLPPRRLTGQANAGGVSLPLEI